MSEFTTIVAAILGIMYVLYKVLAKNSAVQTNQQVLDLTKKIDENTGKLEVVKQEAKDSLNEYEKLKKAYDESVYKSGNNK